MLLIIPIAGSTWALGIMTYIHLLPTSKQLPCWLQQTAEARRVWRREEEGSHHPLASHTHGHQAVRKEPKQKRTRMSPGDPQRSPVSQLLEAWQDLQPNCPRIFVSPCPSPVKGCQGRMVFSQGGSSAHGKGGKGGGVGWNLRGPVCLSQGSQAPPAFRMSPRVSESLLMDFSHKRVCAHRGGYKTSPCSPLGARRELCSRVGS